MSRTLIISCNKSPTEMSTDTGKIITGKIDSNGSTIMARSFLIVKGAIDPAQLGITLTHEHLLVHFEAALQPTRYLDRDVTDVQLKLENQGVIRPREFIRRT